MDRSFIRLRNDGLIPLTDIFAKVIEIPKAIIPNMSSKATTGKMVLVSGPFARYCLITRRVAAGAVAADIDAITILKAKSLLKIKYITEKTITIAPITSANVITNIFLPYSFMSFITNSLPILKAIKARASSLIISSDCASDELTRLKNDGPRSKPNTR